MNQKFGGGFIPRVARIKSRIGIYHIIMRGISRQTILEDQEDYIRFIETMHRYKEICEYKIYAYCLMGNHLHLLLEEGKEPLETVMRRICGSFVLWYNKKYKRVGYLFQDRYKSEPVENNEYFLTVLRYIFLNPKKAGLVFNIQNYQWSNYKDYIQGINQTEVNLVLGIFHKERKKAIDRFVEYINSENDDKCMDLTEKKWLTDDEARKIIRTYYKIEHAIEIQKYDKAKRNQYLKELKEKHGLSIRQIERLTGISRGVIQKI